MRIAVALPSHDERDPLRLSLDATLAELCRTGVEIEAFCEHDRPGAARDFPSYHYLRMPERHAAAPFDIGLYPLGRDATPYQAVYTSMRAYPGVVWFLDPVMHHLFLGGIALYDRWHEYREILDETYGEAGAALAQTIASNWGTGAVYRRYGLAEFAAASQPGVLAAFPALAQRLTGALPDRDIAVAHLPLPPSFPPASVEESAAAASPAAESTDRDDPAAAAPASVRRFAVMTLNESYPETALRAAATILALDPANEVTICVSRPVLETAARPAAERRGIADRVSWEIDASPARMAELAARRDTLIWLAEELQATHRLVLLQGMAAGKPTVVPRAELYEDLPDGAVVKVELGRSLAPLLEAYLRELAADESLRRGLTGAAMSFAGALPDAAAAAGRLRRELERRLESCAMAAASSAADVWDGVGEDFDQQAVPGGIDADARRRLAEALDAHTAAFRRGER